MMPQSQPPRPTPAELEILRSLWQHGPSTVRVVQERLDAERPTGYTTVLKLLQIMTGKGLVKRDESERAHVYTAMAPEEATQQRLVRDLVDRAFGGSACELVLSAIATLRPSRRDVARIRERLDALGADERPSRYLTKR